MTIADVYRTLWRHKLFILLLTVGMAAAAYFLTSRQPKEYTASSLVRIEQKGVQASDLYGSLITGERLARTYALIAETRAVRELVRDRLDASVPDDAIRIDAGQVSNLELLWLGVTYTDPRIAARVANAVPSALAEFVRRNGSSREVVTTIEGAATPSYPSAPNIRMNVILAVLLGLILNSGLVLLIEAFSDRVGSAEELERMTGRPVIVAIPPLDFLSTPPGMTASLADGRSGLRYSDIRPRPLQPDLGPLGEVTTSGTVRKTRRSGTDG